MQAGTSDSMRLFYALWPDDATRSALQALQMHVGGRQTSYANLHVTLAFLGQQRTAVLPALEKILNRLPRVPIELTIDRLAYFNKSRIAWAGSHTVPDSLIELQATLTQALVALDIEVDQRRFTPHVTLARDAEAPQDLAFDPIRWQANEVALVRSLQAGGMLTYQVLASHRLDGIAQY